MTSLALSMVVQEIINNQMFPFPFCSRRVWYQKTSFFAYLQKQFFHRFYGEDTNNNGQNISCRL